MDGVATPRPRDVPAFGRARAAGLTPQVPSEPPQVSVRPTARSALRDVAVVGALGVGSIVTVLAVAGEDGRLSWPAVVTLLAASAVAVAALAVAVRRWGRSLLAELQRGYTTSTFKLGRFWVGAAPDGPLSNGWVQWDWDATWVLGPDGGVVSAPSDGGDPPGLYPSPRREDDLELWTGHQWTGYVPPKDTW